MITAWCMEVGGLTKTTAFYASLATVGRGSAVVAILGSAASTDVAAYAFNPNTKYVIDPDDTTHDVSEILNEAGKVSVRNRIF